VLFPICLAIGIFAYDFIRRNVHSKKQTDMVLGAVALFSFAYMLNYLVFRWKGANLNKVGSLSIDQAFHLVSVAQAICKMFAGALLCYFAATLLFQAISAVSYRRDESGEVKP